MLILPAEIIVRVVNDGHVPVSRILVLLDVFLEGREYYGTVLGLTGSDGLVRRRREEIGRSFEEDRSFFLMDYKVSLAECDPELSIAVLGGPEFQSAKDSALISGVLEPDVAQRWKEATNGLYRSERIDLCHADANGITEIEVQLRQIGESEGC